MQINGSWDNIALLSSRISHNVRGIWIVTKSPHERVCYLNGNIEVVKRGHVLFGVNELEDIWMLHTHHAHVGPTSMSTLLDCIGGFGYDPPETNRP
jgi:hypothetical protein